MLPGSFLFWPSSSRDRQVGQEGLLLSCSETEEGRLLGLSARGETGLDWTWPLDGTGLELSSRPGGALLPGFDGRGRGSGMPESTGGSPMLGGLRLKCDGGVVLV
jgi:hypothetical protein